jgi:hypothetical protein
MEKLIKGTYFVIWDRNNYYCYQIVYVDYDAIEVLSHPLDEDSGPFRFSIKTLEGWLDNNSMQIIETEKELLVFRMKYC